jgi:GTP cyclohydrolase I
LPIDNVWVMPEGTSTAGLTAHTQQLAEAVLARGLNLTTRLHILVWGLNVASDGPVVSLADVDLDAALEVFLKVRCDPRIQLEQATHAAQAFLEALGVDLTRPGMDDTCCPHRNCPRGLPAPQMQEWLTQQIAEWLNESLQPHGVGVVVEAEHTCMTLRGVQAHGTPLMTSALLGQLWDEPAARAEFFDLTGVART